MTVPPARSGRPVTVNGRPSPSPSAVTSAPRSRSAPSSGCIGRAYACASPSKATGPSASRASGGTNRITVPARPQSTVPPLNPAGGVTRHPSADSSTTTPRARSASRISCVSRASRPLTMVEGPLASAASTSARLVSDFEPGTVTVAVTGTGACGAGQGWAALSSVGVGSRSGTRRV